MPTASKRQAEQALKESEERLRLAVDAAALGTWRHDFTTDIVHLDARAQALWGFDHSDVISNEMIARIHPEDRNRVHEQLSRAIDSADDESGFESELRIIRPHGEIRWLSLRARLFFNGKGSARHVAVSIGTCRDITERKRDEAALLEGEARFRQLAENSGQVFWLTDWKKRELLYVSPSYEDVFDRSCESIWEDRRSWLAAVHPEDRERIDRTFAEKGERGETTAEEYRIIRKDGSIRWIRDRSIPLRDATGEVYRWISVAEDITERKQAEEALRASETRFRAFLDHAGASIFLGRSLGLGR